MTRETALRIYGDAARIFDQSALSPDIRKCARQIAIEIEDYIGQVGRVAAKDWMLSARWMR